MSRRLLFGLVLALVACSITTPAPTQFAATAQPALTRTPAPAATLAASATFESSATTPPTETPAPTSAAVTAPHPDCCALQPVITGLRRPTLVTHAGDARLFILEQRGLVDVWVDGGLQTFLDLQSLVGSSANEQGLLGLAFHPDYAANGVFYVNYTNKAGNTVVARYHVAADSNRGDPASAQTLFTVAQPHENHNGGGLAFGPDGLLYIGMGDGGSQGDPQGNGQNPQALLGKMLRLDVDSANGRPEIWAVGLRNAWRFSFDRETGDLFIGDVGQGDWEEIDRVSRAGLSAAGPNFGWNILEGTHRFSTVGDPAGLTGPIAEYSHDEGGCSVTGGFVYRGAALPALRGNYLFADYCTGYIWSLTPDAQGLWDRALFLESGLAVSSFGEDSQGELYVVDHGDGSIYLLVGQ